MVHFFQMRFFQGLFLLSILFCSHVSIGQTFDQEKQPRILLLLDGSSSMGTDWAAKESRFNAASRIITTLMDSLYKVNKNVEFALRVYGHQSPAQYNDCNDTKLEVMFSKDNLTQMSLRLAALRPIGVSPIAYSLKEAAENDLTDLKNNTYSLILITDGEESCGGNICDVVKELLAKRIDFKPYILSLVDNTTLKSQYDCLGNYLTVTADKDIKPTVGKIVEAYKPMLTLTTVQRKVLESTVVKAPSMVNVTIPKFEMKKEVEVTEPAPVPVEQPKPAPKPKTERAETKEPNIVQAPPPTDLTDRTNEVAPDILKEDIAFIRPLISHRTFSIYYADPVLKQRAIPAYNPAKLEVEKLTISPAPAAVKPINKPVEVTTTNVDAPKTVTPPAANYKPIVSAPPPPAVTNKPPSKPVIAPKPERIEPQPVASTKPKELKYTQKNEDAKETTLQVYFSDGKGTFYQTSPQLVLLDPKTKKPVQKFYRTVDAAGIPDLQKIPAGNYNLTITGKANYIVPDVKIEANKNNAIIIPVSEGSIYFAYRDNPKRAVEYTATVFHRFSTSPVVRQKCTQELFYEPGTYHVEINTLPPFKRTFDLNFGEQYQVEIPEEGQLVITNTNSIGRVVLYYPFGDQFRTFYSLQVSGNGEEQKLTLLPGTYKAGFRKTPNSEQTIVDFVITSNNVTNLELK